MLRGSAAAWSALAPHDRPAPSWPATASAISPRGVSPDASNRDVVPDARRASGRGHGRRHGRGFGLAGYGASGSMSWARSRPTMDVTSPSATPRIAALSAGGGTPSMLCAPRRAGRGRSGPSSFRSRPLPHAAPVGGDRRVPGHPGRCEGDVRPQPVRRGLISGLDEAGAVFRAEEGLKKLAIQISRTIDWAACLKPAATTAPTGFWNSVPVTPWRPWRDRRLPEARVHALEGVPVDFRRRRLAVSG